MHEGVTPESVRHITTTIYYRYTDIRIYGMPSIAIYRGSRFHSHAGRKRRGRGSGYSNKMWWLGREH